MHPAGRYWRILTHTCRHVSSRQVCPRSLSALCRQRIFRPHLTCSRRLTLPSNRVIPRATSVSTSSPQISNAPVYSVRIFDRSSIARLPQRAIWSRFSCSSLSSRHRATCSWSAARIPSVRRTVVLVTLMPFCQTGAPMMKEAYSKEDDASAAMYPRPGRLKVELSSKRQAKLSLGKLCCASVSSPLVSWVSPIIQT